MENVVWRESFDLYGTSLTNLTQRGYTLSNTSALLSVPITNPRTGTNSFKVNAGALSATTALLQRTLTTPLTNCVSGVAMMAASQTRNDGCNAGLAIQGTGFLFKLCMGTGNTWNVYTSVTGAPIATSAANVVVPNTYMYMEMQVKENSGGANTGYVEVRQDGNTIIQINGVNVPNQTTSVWLGASGGSQFNHQNTITTFFDDWYINENNFLGICQCNTVFLNANGPNQDFTASAGTALACVNKSTPDDTSYVSTPTVGAVSNFGHAALAGAGNTFYSIEAICRGAIDVAGAAGLKVGVRSNATDSYSAEYTPSTTFAYFSGVFQQDPNGNIPWTRAAIDALLIDMQRSS